MAVLSLAGRPAPPCGRFLPSGEIPEDRALRPMVPVAAVGKLLLGYLNLPVFFAPQDKIVMAKELSNNWLRLLLQMIEKLL